MQNNMQKTDKNTVENRVIAIEGCLRDSRASKKHVDRLVEILDGVKLEDYLGEARDEVVYAEDDNPEPERFLYDKNRFRELYLLEVIRRYILNAGKTLPYKMSVLAAEGLLRISFNLHPDYHGSLSERRVAFAQDTGFVTKSQNPDSLVRNCANRENELFHFIAEKMVQEEVRTKQLPGIAFEVYTYMHDERDKERGRIDAEVVRNTMPDSKFDDVIVITPHGEQTDFTVFYLSLSGMSEAEYKKLSPAVVRDSLSKRYSLYALDKEFLEKTAKEDTGKVREGIIEILKNDPIYAYMTIRAMCTAEIDPVIPYYGASAEENQPVPKIITGKGKVLHQQQPWVNGFINRMEDYLSGFYFGDDHSYEEIFRDDLNEILKRYKELLGGMFDQMRFKGVQYVRSSRNYRIYPQFIKGREYCIKSDPVQITADWLVFDYMSELGKIAFSVGFRPDELRCAIFSPYRNFP